MQTKHFGFFPPHSWEFCRSEVILFSEFGGGGVGGGLPAWQLNLHNSSLSCSTKFQSLLGHQDRIV